MSHLVLNLPYCMYVDVAESRTCLAISRQQYRHGAHCKRNVFHRPRSTCNISCTHPVWMDSALVTGHDHAFLCAFCVRSLIAGWLLMLTEMPATQLRAVPFLQPWQMAYLTGANNFRWKERRNCWWTQCCLCCHLRDVLAKSSHSTCHLVKKLASNSFMKCGRN